MFALYLGMIAILDSTAIILARYYVEKGKWLMLLGSLASFAAAGFVYVKLMAFAATAIVNVLYLAISTIFVTLVFYFVFKERVTWGQAAGIVIVVIGISMLEI